MDYDDMITMQVPNHEQPQRMAIYFDRKDAQLMVEALCLLRCQIQDDRRRKSDELSEAQLFRLGEKMGAIDRIKFYIDSSMPQGSE